MHSTRYEGKSVIAERFIRTLQNKIRKYMTSVLKNKYTNKLDNLVNQHNNTYHNTIQMKPADKKSNTYIEFKENIKEGPNFEVEIFFAEGYTANLSEEVFVIKEVKNTVPCTYVIGDLNGEEITGMFYEK